MFLKRQKIVYYQVNELKLGWHSLLGDAGLRVGFQMS